MIETKIEIKNERIIDNLNYINNEYKKDFLFVLKSNAYNTGIKTTTKVCVDAGYKTFAVCTVEEALTIRSISDDAFVFIMNPLDAEEIKLANDNDFVISLSNLEWFDEHYDLLKKSRMHLKINIGMNRFGFDDIKVINKLINENENIEGLYTHFAQADMDDLTLHNNQVDEFVALYNNIENKNQLKMIHSENSAALLYRDERLSFCNYTRFGVLGYGITPLDIMPELSPIVFVSTQVGIINKYKKGGYVGYGINAPLEKDTTIAVCPLGYGLGLNSLRKLVPVIINNKEYKVLSITMNHLIIEVDDDVKVKDNVEVYGDNVMMDHIFVKEGTACTVHLTSLHTNKE